MISSSKWEGTRFHGDHCFLALIEMRRMKIRKEEYFVSGHKHDNKKYDNIIQEKRTYTKKRNGCKKGNNIQLYLNG